MSVSAELRRLDTRLGLGQNTGQALKGTGPLNVSLAGKPRGPGVQGRVPTHYGLCRNEVKKVETPREEGILERAIEKVRN